MKIKFTYLKAIFVCFLLLSTTGSSIDISNKSTQESNNIYVDWNNGSDINGTGAEDNPFKTINKGIEVSQEEDTIVVLPGTYKEGVAVKVEHNVNIIGATGNPSDVKISATSSENSLKVFEKCTGGKIANVEIDYDHLSECL